MSSDTDFFVLRRFATLNTRVLLAKQAQIYHLGRILDDLDNPKDGELPPINNDTVLNDQRYGRNEILDELWRLLKEYNEFVTAYSTLSSRPAASRFELQNLRNWLDDYNGAICANEEQLLRDEGDLIPIVVKTKSLLRRAIEHSSILLGSFLFGNRSKNLASADSESKYFNDDKVDKFVYYTIVGLGLGMLVGPLWLLDKVNPSGARLGIITAFIVVFTVLIGLSTRATAIETMAGTAAYAAVLMVMMQINNPPSN